MTKTTLAFIALCVAITTTNAQTSETTETKSDTTIRYYVSATLGGGYAYDISGFEAPRPGVEINRNQYTFFARLMWHPEWLLSAGVESGYMQFYTIETPNGGKLDRGAVPVLLLFSMRMYEGLSGTVGFGVGLLNSTAIGANGDKVNGSDLSFAVMGSLSYLHPIGNGFSIGAEVRYTNMDLYDDDIMTGSVMVSYRLFDYAINR